MAGSIVSGASDLPRKLDPQQAEDLLAPSADPPDKQKHQLHLLVILALPGLNRNHHSIHALLQSYTPEDSIIIPLIHELPNTT